MKIVIAPDSFKESLSSSAVAHALEKGIKAVFPTAIIQCIPVADGGEGTVQAMVEAMGGSLEHCTVTAPLGRLITATFGLSADKKTAVLEMAEASGLGLVAPSERNPLKTSTFGTGQMIKAALNTGARHLILGIGGSATNDGGIGMAQALGVRFFDSTGQPLAEGAAGQDLGRISTLDISGLDPRLADCKIDVACDVDNPLTGPAGASATFGPQKGATPAMVRQLDQALASYAACVDALYGHSVAAVSGTGAAGGLGYALLAFLKARLRPGIEIVVEAINLDAALKDADLVITGEGRIDSQTIHGKTPIGVARVAKRYNKPVIGIAGSLSADVGIVHDHGLDAVFSILYKIDTLENALAEAAFNLEMTARNIAAVLKMGGRF